MKEFDRTLFLLSHIYKQDQLVEFGIDTDLYYGPNDFYWYSIWTDQTMGYKIYRASHIRKYPIIEYDHYQNTNSKENCFNWCINHWLENRKL